MKETPRDLLDPFSEFVNGSDVFDDNVDNIDELQLFVNKYIEKVLRIPYGNSLFESNSKLPGYIISILQQLIKNFYLDKNSIEHFNNIRDLIKKLEQYNTKDTVYYEEILEKIKICQFWLNLMESNEANLTMNLLRNKLYNLNLSAKSLIEGEDLSRVRLDISHSKLDIFTQIKSFLNYLANVVLKDYKKMDIVYELSYLIPPIIMLYELLRISITFDLIKEGKDEGQAGNLMKIFKDGVMDLLNTAEVKLNIILSLEFKNSNGEKLTTELVDELKLLIIMINDPVFTKSLTKEYPELNLL